MDSEKLKNLQKVDPPNWLDRYGDYLYRFALTRLRNEGMAEEAVQDTLVSALINVKQFAGRGNERAWLLGILKNKVIDHYRHRKRDPLNVDEQTADIAERFFDEQGSWRQEIRPTIRRPLDSMDRKEFWGMLKKCIAELSDRQADVFTLRTMDEKSAEEICKALEITSSNYWVILHRTRLQLSSCMKKRWFHESH
jgi:RNA polymerase sigma-70 factor (ECF subfamily)